MSLSLLIFTWVPNHMFASFPSVPKLCMCVCSSSSLKPRLFQLPFFWSLMCINIYIFSKVYTCYEAFDGIAFLWSTYFCFYIAIVHILDGIFFHFYSWLVSLKWSDFLYIYLSRISLSLWITFVVCMYFFS